MNIWNAKISLHGAPIGVSCAVEQLIPQIDRILRLRRMGRAAALPLQPPAGDDAADQIRLADYRTALDSAARARGHDRKAANARPDREGQMSRLAPPRHRIGQQVDGPDAGIR